MGMGILVGTGRGERTPFLIMLVLENCDRLSGVAIDMRAACRNRELRSRSGQEVSPMR